MHFYRFHISDYMSHTKHLSKDEDLAYRRMLDWMYLHEKPLPLDIRKIGRLIDMRDDEQAISDVLDEFFVEQEGGFTQLRVSEESLHISECQREEKGEPKSVGIRSRIGRL